MPTIWPLQSDAVAMNALYGNPDANGDGAPDPTWMREHLTTIIPPYRMVLAWKPKRVVNAITVNKGCASALLHCLTRIRDHYGDQAAIEKARMHLFGGVYNFRPIRGGQSLSCHARGAAIDLDPERNKQGTAGTMPPDVVEIFRSEGAVPGIEWSGRSRDPMHFQFARVH